MVLIKQVTGNLVGGVSTLAEAHRQPNQTKSQTNAEPSIIEGLRKRAKTTFKGAFATNPSSAKFHSIFQDGVEEYVLAATTDSVQAMDAQTGDNLGVYKLTRNTGGSITGGTPVTPTDLAYLNNASPSGTSPFTTPDPVKDFEFLTLGDTTLILNRKVFTDEHVVSGTTPDTLFWGYVFLKQLASPSSSQPSKLTIEFQRSDYAGQLTEATVVVPQAPVPYNTQYDLDKQHVRPDLMLSMLRKRIEGGSSYPVLFDDMYFPGDDGQDIPTTNESFAYDSTNSQTWPVMDTYVLPLAIDGSNHGIAENIDNLKAHYSNGEAFVSAFTDKVSYIDDLPTVCHNGKTVRVTGNPASDQDDYYVTFRTTEGFFGKGVWEETAYFPYNKVGPDPAKMPHLLIRRQDDISGTVTGTASQIYFEYAPLDGSVSDINDGDPWGYQRCGDNSQPKPAFLGDISKGIRKGIEDMFFYNNRLGFITRDGDISLSEAGSYFQFYRKSVNQLLDTDPIHASISGATTGKFRYAIPFSRELLVLGDNVQYSLNNGGGVTSPRTISIDRISGYEMSQQARPVVLENTAVFASSGTNHNQVWQMYRQDDVSYNAAETTEAVPGYIQGPAIGLAASSVVGMIAVPTDTGRLFCHNYFRQGNQLLQQAWWELLPANIGKVRFAQFVGDTLRIVVEKKTSADASTSQLVVIDYEPDNADTFHADYASSGTFSGSYNATTDQTSIVLPYGTTDDDTVAVYNLTQSVWEDVVSVTPGASSTTVYLDGDVAGDTLQVGVPFNFSVGLHAPVLAIRNTERTQSPERAQRVLVNKMDLTYTDTLPFDVEIDSKHRAARVFNRPYNITGDIGAKADTPDPQSGVLEVGIHLPTDDLEITIRDTSSNPVKLENIQWEMNYRPRARTWAGR